MSMQKKVLSEKALYTVNIEMPQGFEIDREQLKSDILESKLSGDLKFSKSWDMLKNYVIENVRLKHNISLVNKETYGIILKPEEKSDSFINANLMDLKNSCDFVMIYGVSIFKNSCKTIISYDNNRIKNNCHGISLNNNSFIMFPSTEMYRIMNDSFNYSYLLVINYQSL